MKPEAGVLWMYSDLHCPYAYLAAWRLRAALRASEQGREGEVVVVHKSLAIEWVDEKPTPKDVLDAESSHVFVAEPHLPWQPWRAPESEWPVTMWPAFEAVKCAQRQGWRPAHELDWRIREAFFARSECVSMHHVLLRLARGVPGLDFARFREDLEAGACKAQVVQEAREGWERVGCEVSPTFLLPDGTLLANPAAPLVHLDEETKRVDRVDPPPVPREEAPDVYRRMLQAAARR